MAKYFSIKPSESAERSNFFVVESIESIESATNYTLITLGSGKKIAVQEFSQEVFERITTIQDNDVTDFIEFVGDQEVNFEFI